MGRAVEVGDGVNVVGAITCPALHPDKIRLYTIKRIVENLVFIGLSFSNASFTLLQTFKFVMADNRPTMIYTANGRIIPCTGWLYSRQYLKARI